MYPKLAGVSSMIASAQPTSSVPASKAPRLRTSTSSPPASDAPARASSHNRRVDPLREWCTTRRCRATTRCYGRAASAAAPASSQPRPAPASAAPAAPAAPAAAPAAAARPPGPARPAAPAN